MITNHFSHISHSLYRQTGNLPFLIPMHCYKDSKSIINLIRHSLQSVDITSRKFTFIKSRDTSSSPWHKFITVLQRHWCNLRQNCSDQSRSVKEERKRPQWWTSPYNAKNKFLPKFSIPVFVRITIHITFHEKLENLRKFLH